MHGAILFLGSVYKGLVILGLYAGCFLEKYSEVIDNVIVFVEEREVVLDG